MRIPFIQPAQIRAIRRIKYLQCHLLMMFLIQKHLQSSLRWLTIPAALLPIQAVSVMNGSLLFWKEPKESEPHMFFTLPPAAFSFCNIPYYKPFTDSYFRRFITIVLFFISTLNFFFGVKNLLPILLLHNFIISSI